MNFWRRQGKAIVVGGGFLGLVVVGLAFLAASFLADLATKIPPTARPALHPLRLGLVCEDVELRAKDGKKIAGWWMPKGAKGNPPVVVLHGLGAGKAHMIDYILFAQAAGYPVLAIDFRGHGTSEASLTSIGYYESWDVEAAMDFVNWVGAFVFAVGLSYAWALSRESLPVVWKITALVRSVIAVFLIGKVLAGSMPANWLGVAVCDGFVALVQFVVLWRRRIGGGA